MITLALAGGGVGGSSGQEGHHLGGMWVNGNFC